MNNGGIIFGNDRPRTSAQDLKKKLLEKRSAQVPTSVNKGAVILKSKLSRDPLKPGSDEEGKLLNVVDVGVVEVAIKKEMRGNKMYYLSPFISSEGRPWSFPEKKRTSESIRRDLNNFVKALNGIDWDEFTENNEKAIKAAVRHEKIVFVSEFASK